MLSLLLTGCGGPPGAERTGAGALEEAAALPLSTAAPQPAQKRAAAATCVPQREQKGMMESVAVV